MAGLGSGVEVASPASAEVGASGRLSTGPWGVPSGQERGSLRGQGGTGLGGMAQWDSGSVGAGMS